MTTKIADSKGRVALGSRFAHCTFIIDDSDVGKIILKPAVAIPAQEAWLYENQTALNLVRQGLAQAREGKFSKSPPNLAQDADLAAELEE